MSDKKMNGDVKRGELLLLTSGEYSDYGVHCIVQVLQDVDVYALVGRFRAQPQQYDKDKFIAWLCENNYVEDVGYREFYLGSYGEEEDIELHEIWSRQV